MKKVLMTGKTKKYNVFIKENSFPQIISLLEQHRYSTVVIVYDSKINISIFNDSPFFKKRFCVEVSEEIKTLETVENLLTFLSENSIKKGSLILAIGGGVITDLVGFVSSIYMRGIDVAYVPTTLMGMVDASVGSKNGIDFHGDKNKIGTFHDPKFVLMDPKFLETLPQKEISSGISEIIKISYLTNIKILKLLDVLSPDYEKLIYFVVSAKNKFIEKDYSDTKERQFLNFGHTYGHAIEAYYKFQKYTHGEAVAIGMCLAYPSKQLMEVLMKYKLPTQLEQNINIENLFALMKNDKKNTGNKKVKIISLSEIGKPFFTEIESHFDILKTMERVRIYGEKIKNEQ